MADLTSSPQGLETRHTPLEQVVILSRNAGEAKKLGLGYLTTPDSSVAPLLQNDRLLPKCRAKSPLLEGNLGETEVGARVYFY